MPDHPALLSRLSGGDWSLVASLVFKTSDTSKRRVVGSIPIHLRQPAGSRRSGGLVAKVS